MPPSSVPIITINLSSHPSKCPLGIILAPTKIDLNYESLQHSTTSSSTAINSMKMIRTDNNKSNNNKSNSNSNSHKHHNIHENNQFNPQNSTTIVLVGYTRHNHKMGPIQQSNLVRLGDVLVEINGVSVRKMSFQRVMDLLKCLVYGSGWYTNNGSNNNNNNNGRNEYVSGKGGGHVSLNSLSFEDGRMYYATYFGNYIGGGAGGTGAAAGIGAGLSLLSTVVGGGDLHYGGGGGGGNENKNHNTQWSMARENVLYSFSSWIHRARLRQEEEEEEEEVEVEEEQQSTTSSSLSINHSPDLHHESSFDDRTSNNINNAANNNHTQNTKQKNKPPQIYVQYEIKCTLKIKQNNQQEEEITWSTWKRYSQFKKLDDHIRKTFHWSMENIKFPSSNIIRSAFYGGGKHSKFVQRRKNELEIYWNDLSCNVDGLFDFGDPFSSHRYSYKMAEFLDLKRGYFQPRMIGGGIGIGIGGGVGSGYCTGGVSVSVSSSKPNVIQVEGNSSVMMDESSLSILSNSVDGGGGITTGAAVSGGVATQGGTSSVAMSSSGQFSSGGGSGSGGGGGIGMGGNKSICDLSVNSEGGVMSSNGCAPTGKKKKKRKKVVAKAAYQRRLMDDL